MADTKVSNLTDGVTANATDRIPAARAGANVYVTPAYIKDYILGLANTWTVNGAASTPSQLLNGTWFTGGSATTTKPQFLVEPTGTTSTGWSTSGTGIGVNAASGFAGNLIDAQVAGVSRFLVTPGPLTGITLRNATDNVSGLISMFTTGGPTADIGFGPVGGNGNFLMSVGFAGAFVTSNWFIGWGSTSAITTSTPDLKLFRDAANVLGLRNGTNVQTLNWYGNQVDATDYHRGALKVAKTTLSNVSGASVTATGLIPDGAFCIGVTTKVTTAISGGGGTTGYQIGDGSDADRWGEATTITAGTSTDNTNATANPTGAFTAAQNVVITAVGGNFNGTGDIMVCAFYLIAQAD